MARMEQELADALLRLDEDDVMRLTEQLVREGLDAIRIEEALQKGMQEAEVRYEEGEYFLGDLIVAGTLFVEALSAIPKREFGDGEEAVGKVLIGVVNEDIHDIGKDIVVQVLRSHGFEVLDLGVDVAPEHYVDTLEEYRPDVATLSGVMGGSPYEMKKIVDLMAERGLRDMAPVIIGGACASERVRLLVGADAYAEGPIDTLTLCQRIIETGRCE